MDIKLTICLDKKTEQLIDDLISVLRPGANLSVAQETRKVEEISDTDMATTEVKTCDPVEKVDYAALKKKAKDLGVKLVQMKKKAEVQELTAKYGYKKISEIKDEDIESYLNELKGLLSVYGDE